MTHCLHADICKNIIELTEDKYKFDVYYKIVVYCCSGSFASDNPDALIMLTKENIVDLFELTIVDRQRKSNGLIYEQGYYRDGLFIRHSLKHNKCNPAYKSFHDEDDDGVSIYHYHHGKQHSYVNDEGNRIPSFLVYNGSGALLREDYAYYGKLHSFINKNGIVQPATIMYNEGGSQFGIDTEFYYTHGNYYSFTDNNGNLLPAIRKYNENIVYYDMYYRDSNHDLFKNQPDATYLKIFYDEQSQISEVLYYFEVHSRFHYAVREEAYKNGKLQSFYDDDGNICAAVIKNYDEIRIASEEHYDCDMLHTFKDANGNNIPAIIEYDINGKVITKKFFDHGILLKC